jgi:chromosome partitioning protein
MKIISVVSIKGGVGKTTTCINLAAYVAAMGVRVLLVDLDPQNGVMFGMGLDDYHGATLKDVLLYGIAPGQAMAHTNHPELRVMLAGKFADGDELERFERAFESNGDALEPLMRAVALGWGFAMTVSDSLVLPVQCEPLSLRTFPQTLKRVMQLKAEKNPKLDIEGVLLTMYDAKMDAVHGVARQVWESFPENLVFETLIPRHEQLASSFAVGMPAVDLSTRSSGAQAYIQLGRELVMRLPEN